MNAKFIKIFKKYCEFNSMNWKKARKMFDDASPKTQEEYKKEITDFVVTRKQIENQLVNNSSVIIPENKKIITS